jgi:hypothetical protein
MAHRVRRWGVGLTLSAAALLVLGTAAHGAYGTYQLTVTTKNWDGSAANDCFVKFHNLTTNSSSTWRYTGLNDNQFTFYRSGCSKYDSARVQVVKDTLLGNTKSGNIRYVICDSIESKTVKISSGIILVAGPYAYAEPAPMYGGGRSGVTTAIALTTDCEDSTQYATTVRFSAHFDPGSLQVLSVTPNYGGPYYDTYYDWNNTEGWVTYECSSYNPDGEPVPGPTEPTAELAYVEFEGTATIDPCWYFGVQPYDPVNGRQDPSPSSVNGIFCIPTETHFPYFPPVSAQESPIGLKPLPFEVSAARPNPFSSITAIEFSLKGGSHHVLLRVLDARGRPLKTLASGTFEAGSHTVYWDGKDERGETVPEGVYFYQFEAEDNRINRKVILAR